MTVVIYLLFFLSGAAALVYEVLWVRSLQLLFGGSHLAVTVVLSVFMTGLATGSYLIGKSVGAHRKPLRLYGILEIGIAVFAVIFLLLMKLYPYLYIPLARMAEENTLYLSFLRVLFAVAAMIVPTTLMGGTLPVLATFVSSRSGSIGGRISFLYGFNTLGAVVGTLAAGFLLLPNYSVSFSMAIAIAINVSIGLVSFILHDRMALPGGSKEDPVQAEMAPMTGVRESRRQSAEEHFIPAEMVLWGIGISGFCALGYEVLWTRVLTMVVGASVYGFTVMLVAFLTGIALGSKAFGVLINKFPHACRRREGSIILFGMVQVIIGLTALGVTYFLRDLPAQAIRIQNNLLGSGISDFEVRQWANFTVAFTYMFFPAVFMGFAFPLAGMIHADSGKSSGEAIGEVLAYNTVGAILGAAVSGFALIYLFGIERSLKMLTLVNAGAGLFIAFGARRNSVMKWLTAGATAVTIVILAAYPHFWRIWDLKYFAIYRHNTRHAFGTAFNMKDAMENTDVLYYAEGVQATVSSIKVKGGYQAFITNGRIEASNHKEGIQCQYTLGHLPMLLNKNPKRVFVLGTGSGMTLGATSVHPGVEEIVLTEIEPKVLGVARTFEKYNHAVLDNPKLRIVFNDGRNFLLTTEEKFDVITADPIHPWFSGAGYLYTKEYFRLAADRLRPGGIICQWLPIYELSVDDLKCIVRTFSENFRFTLLWLTRNDAELVGSHDPIVIDEAELEKRIAAPGVNDDLKSVNMGSADDFLSYFVMGSDGMRAFGAGGVVNTDDNLHIEFSAPLSMDVPALGKNAHALYQIRENLLSYLRPAKGEAARSAQTKKWDRYFQAGRDYALAHILFLRGASDTSEFKRIMRDLGNRHPDYAPLKFLIGEVQELEASTPTLIQAEQFMLLNAAGEKIVVEISAVKVRIGEERAAVLFVDNRARIIYGQKYIDSDKNELEGEVRKFAVNVMENLMIIYKHEANQAMRDNRVYPFAGTTLYKMKEAISSASNNSKQ